MQITPTRNFNLLYNFRCIIYSNFIKLTYLEQDRNKFDKK